MVDEALLSELDEEFDSDKFDQKMAHMFDEGYYQMNEDDSDEVTETPEDLQEIFQEIDERGKGFGTMAISFLVFAT